MREIKHWINVVRGDRVAVETLLEHPDVQAISRWPDPATSEVDLGFPKVR
jgi:hypothetical protein